MCVLNKFDCGNHEQLWNESILQKKDNKIFSKIYYEYLDVSRKHEVLQNTWSSTEYMEVYRIHGGLQNTWRSAEYMEVYRIQGGVQNTCGSTDYIKFHRIHEGL